MKDLFEGVYLKHQKNGESICFIAGRAGETQMCIRDSICIMRWLAGRMRESR